MKKHICLIVALTLISTVSIAAADVFDAESNITSVVVYEDRALVTRTANLDLKEGDHTIVFGDLPANMDIDSLRAEGRGDASVLILSLESKHVILEVPRERRMAELNGEMQKVKDALADAKILGENLANELALVRSIGVYSGEQFSKEFITRQPNLDEWNAMVEFQRKNVMRLSEEVAGVRLQTRELATLQNKIKRLIEQIKGRSERSGLEVNVSISARSTGKLRLALSSIIHGASWRPTYDARADLKSGEVEISYIGSVTQNTGEDWKDVDISLSTARPAVGAAMPELDPWIIQPMYMPKYAPGSGEMYDARVDRFLITDINTIFTGNEVEVAKVVQRETSAQFEILGKMDVPSDNASHRMTILAKKLPAEFSHSATPRLSPFAFLSAKITNETEAQWLSGEVSVFVDGDYIGSSKIAPVAKNEEITLDLGIDEAITVEREILSRLEGETLILGKRELTFKDKIHVQNHKSRETTLTLFDHIPVAGHRDVKISKLKFSRDPSEKDEDKGMVKWVLPLKPSEKKDITIEFLVTHPKDMEMNGI
jgi:uncharacterized protein (TIGR02231 family)